MMSVDTSQMRPLADAGFPLIPLHPWNRTSRDKQGRDRKDGKRPRDKDWVRRSYVADQVMAEAAKTGINVGVRLGSEHLVIDYDPRNDPSGTAFDELILWTGADPRLWPAVRTGGGGLHIYLTKPVEVLLIDSLEAFPGVEFKTRGRQVVAPGSIHPEQGRPYEWLRVEGVWEADPDDIFLGLPEAPEAILDVARRPERSVGAPVDPGHHTAEELAEMLGALEPGNFQDHAAWFTLMQACHHATAGEGRTEFVEWSTGDPRYAEDAWIIGRRWDSLDASRADGVTYRTLHKALRDAGREDAIPGMTGDAADDFDDDLEVDLGAEAPKSPKDHMAEWVFVADAMRFVRREDLKQFKPDQWNSLYASLDPEHNLVSRVYKGKTPVRRFEAMAYVPAAKEVLGKSTYNLWRPSGVASREGDVSVMEGHLEYLFPDPVERGHVLDFMHFVCCRPELKVMFAPLIQGQQGTGKTALGVLLKRIIGAANVAEPSPDELRERWTKWQEGASLAIVEELMTNGRLELANKLKPVITNETLRIEDKGAPLYSIPNHLNMMCFTNHKNAMRLEEGDRRWLVIFSPAEPREASYYERLWSFIESKDGPAAWKHRLERHAPKLNPKGRAPMTTAKAEMREASMNEVESTVAEWMASRTGPLRHDLFRFEDAWAALPASTRPHKSALKLALQAAGCERHTRQTNPSLPAVMLWSVQDHDKWKEAGAADRTRAWMDMQGIATKEEFDLLN
ncbi:bifunctional DNA primase/polymerase [Albimonas sp. CAU 1670]|uniref:bifunctional DNA primase/polymerase n=1 Tax=Albimonas sp. CAU 1670 TaxID=3032599 RepID=UPI0023DBF0DF|nr:bifunctional DNA primase/polymerase [Albimonas sp. CAU 1670]MDF2231586.1 bifunctional DNA primase/polymerase [Albimonas sp. CAU 1670]